MASSSVPEEIMTWYLLPAIRKGLAEEMMKSGLSQHQAAHILGVTDAAVSQYMSGKRAGEVRLDPGIKRMISESSKRIAGGANVIGEINMISESCMDRLVVCRIHKEHGAPKRCDICFRKVKE